MYTKPARWGWSPALLDPTFAPLARGLAFLCPLWDGGGGAIDFIRDRFFDLEASAFWGSGPLGFGSNTTATTTGHFGNITSQPITTHLGDGTGDFSILVVGDPISETRVDVLASQRSSASPFQGINMAANSDGSLANVAGQFAFVTFNTAGSSILHAGSVDGAPHCWLGTRRGSLHALWRDGVQVGGPTSLTVRTVFAAGQKFRIGSFADSAGNFACQRNVYLAAGWDRGLSDAESNIVSSHPFGLISRAYDSLVLEAALAAARRTLALMGVGA